MKLVLLLVASIAAVLHGQTLIPAGPFCACIAKGVGTAKCTTGLTKINKQTTAPTQTAAATTLCNTLTGAKKTNCIANSKSYFTGLASIKKFINSVKKCITDKVTIFPDKAKNAAKATELTGVFWTVFKDPKVLNDIGVARTKFIQLLPTKILKTTKVTMIMKGVDTCSTDFEKANPGLLNATFVNLSLAKYKATCT